VPVKGDIDKLEFDGHYANIVDYKTGKLLYAKKEMKGPATPEDKGGNYWRQGVFYAIMLDNQTTNDWVTKEVRFEMVDEEYIGPLSMELNAEGRAHVVLQVQKAYNSIMNHEFSIGCGEEGCYWCEFQKQQ